MNVKYVYRALFTNLSKISDCLPHLIVIHLKNECVLDSHKIGFVSGELFLRIRTVGKSIWIKCHLGS